MRTTISKNVKGRSRHRLRIGVTAVPSVLLSSTGTLPGGGLGGSDSGGVLGLAIPADGGSVSASQGPDALAGRGFPSGAPRGKATAASGLSTSVLAAEALESFKAAPVAGRRLKAHSQAQATSLEAPKDVQNEQNEQTVDMTTPAPIAPTPAGAMDSHAEHTAAAVGSASETADTLTRTPRGRREAAGSGSGVKGEPADPFSSMLSNLLKKSKERASTTSSGSATKDAGEAATTDLADARSVVRTGGEMGDLGEVEQTIAFSGDGELPVAKKGNPNATENMRLVNDPRALGSAFEAVIARRSKAIRDRGEVMQAAPDSEFCKYLNTAHDFSIDGPGKEEVRSRPGVIIIPVSASKDGSRSRTGGSRSERAVQMPMEQYKLFTSLVDNLDQDQLLAMANGDRRLADRFERLQLQGELYTPAIVAFANQDPSFHSYIWDLIRRGPHPLWNADGTVKRDLLAPNWTVQTLKAIGEVPVRATEESFLSNMTDHMLYDASKGKAPIDDRRARERADAADIDHGIFGFLGKFTQKLWGKKITFSQAADEKEYAMDLLEDRPVLGMTPMKTGGHDLPDTDFEITNDTIASMYTGANLTKTPTTRFNKVQICKISTELSNMSSVAEGYYQKKHKEEQAKKELSANEDFVNK